MRSLYGVAAAVTVALGGAVCGVSHAQTAAADAQANDSLENIIVTARRREEQVQDVPLAISVVNAAQLEQTGTFNVGKLSQIQPSIQFYSSNPRNSAANIRGLGAPFGLTNDGIEQGVGIYIDQVYYARSATATFDFLDVDQIEILRGPQGTLYGKNTTSGAINVTSRKPSFTREADAELTYGNLGFAQGKASISGPLIDDKLAFRLGTSYTQRDGTIRNAYTGEDINEQDNLGFKGQLLWQPSDDLSVTFSADYTHSNPLGFGQLYVRTGSTQRPLSRQYAALAAASNNYQVPSTDPFDRVTDLDANLSAKQNFGGGSALVEWDVGPGRFTSVSAYRKWDWVPANDRDFIGLPITTISENPSQQRQWTQEFRYAASSEKLDYVAGLYGFYQTIDTNGVQEQGELASRWLLSGANANNPAILDGLRAENDIGLKNTSVAAFGQVTWHVTDDLRLQPGLRVNYDKKDGRYIATVTNSTNTPLTPAQLGVLAPQNYTPKFDDTNISGDFTVSYDIADNVLAYGTYARSFKSGGINLSGLPLDANNQPITAVETVKPETVNHYEAGLKTQWLENRVTANLALFWTEIDDYQATVTNSQANVIRGYLANAEQIRVRGVELDLSTRPLDGLTVYANGAYNDHEYTSFPDAPCPPELSGGTAASAANPPSAPGTPGGFSPPSCDISGQWLPGISKYSASYGLQYDLPVAALGRTGSVFFAFDGLYRSEFSSNPSRSAYTDVDGYSLANFRAGINIGNGWQVYGWARNAFDEEYFDFLSTQSGSTGLVIGQPGDPRTYGVTVRGSF
ncbi:iron complex outermembrane receptor protein [Povalibacter uvarum]|uniref:Iron complex outermembrane receptor protein n=1 Tax=Povalibacter uvarum TaxID=732238 RepID=A0A841HJB4_9GAMM|nr:TonB-dependent receptor [Povalibacter uvarum]MBB6092813.1 iron complex outermembrane receptor protein [Povalibacter uvarum]